MDSVEARTDSQTGEEEISLALIVEMLRGQRTQLDAFMGRLDRRQQGLREDQQELEVADGSALEDQCWTGDRNGHVGGDCPSNEIENEESELEEPCDAGPEVVAESEADVAKPEEPAACVMAAVVVPCQEPLAS
ncbi:Hypothetical predicted protein [Octopus vulgaris]|uniref:Uncharacterized protein n=1 Tax=Octopus vulgaris TaxID=6645 RepID=A0AA36FAK4_OCTVU|nr:Hypothetical predicted protein [Octopus vulgaris]